MVIFGDGEDQLVSKAVWSALAGLDVRLIKAHSFPLDDGILEHSHLAIVSLINMANKSALKHMRGQVCNIIGVAPSSDPAQQAELMEMGCDMVLPHEYLGQPALRQILLVNIEKARERMQVRERAEEGKLLDAAIDSSPESFILFDAHHKLSYVSTHFRRAYPRNGHKLRPGIDVMEAFELGGVEHGFKEGEPRYERMREFWQRLDGQTELELDGGRIWRIIARKLPDNLGTMVTTTDITKYLRQQREIEQKSRELAIALEKEKEYGEIQKQFINMVSHEFRTPLSIIDGNAQVLQRRADTLDKDMLQQKVRVIRSAVSRLVGMMEGVLSSSMLKTGKMQLVPELFDLKILIEELCREYEDLSNTPRIECVLEGLPPSVFLDRKAMILILTNLIGNAVKFSRGAAQIHVRASLREGLLEISVKDNGIGIPRGELDKVFARYYRASTASGIPGTGIGLSLVKDLVDLQWGTVALESREGAGTMVMVTLPLRDVSVEE